MTTEIKKDPKESKWLFMKVRAHVIKNGRFDTEVIVVDEGGELVALSRHVSLALVRKSPEEIKRIYRL
jgi:archaeosine-15-forming tRNA-guanine transglycosylase